MKDAAPFDFGTIIAFLLPGFVSFYSLAYVSPRARELVTAVLSKDAGTGLVMVVVLISLAAGGIVSAFRQLVLDKFQHSTGVEKPKLNVTLLANKDKLAAWKSVISNTYRFAQFYGNMFIAILFVFFGKALTDSTFKEQPWSHAAILITAIVLFLAHRKELELTYQRLDQFLK